MRFRVVCGFFGFLFAGAVAAAAPAAPPAAPAHRQLSCASDAARFCADVPYGEGRRIACLAKHMKQLTPDCQKLVPIMQSLYEYGKKQQERTDEILAKRKAAEKAAAEKKSGTSPQP